MQLTIIDDTSLRHTCTVLKLLLSSSQNIAYNEGVLIVNALVLCNLCECYVSHIWLKTRFFGLHFCRT